MWHTVCKIKVVETDTWVRKTHASEMWNYLIVWKVTQTVCKMQVETDTFKCDSCPCHRLTFATHLKPFVIALQPTLSFSHIQRPHTLSKHEKRNSAGMIVTLRQVCHTNFVTLRHPLQNVVTPISENCFRWSPFPLIKTVVNPIKV